MTHCPPASAPPAPTPANGWTLSIVVPALNEEDNVAELVAQIDQHVVRAVPGCELIVVDDGSTDQTLARLQALAASHPWLCVLHRPSPMGQSAAMGAGMAVARGPFIATLDADLQNDPADLPAMLQLLEEHQADLVQGDRSRDRRDSLVRRVGSIVGRLARRWMLGDPVRDTGCSARVMRSTYARRIPLQFRGMHRFIPAWVALMGGVVIEMDVRHRARVAGTTKYGMGVLTRGPAGLRDLFAMRWMRSRWRDIAVMQINSSGDKVP